MGFVPVECPSRNVQQTAGNIRRQEGFGFRIGALVDAINVPGYVKIPKKHLLYTVLQS